MQQDDEPLSGEVEADDMYVGGKPRQSDRAKWDAKTPSRRAVAAQKWSAERKTQVFGAVERGGRVRASVVPKGTVGESARLLTVYVDEESTLYTDEYVGFNKPGEGFAAHKRIKHAERVYVDGDVHTQTIEGFWSLVKRGISGTHHAVSAKHLQGYLNEYAWRYNHRDDEAPTFLTLLESI
jgi:transposase-like protein